MRGRLSSMAPVWSLENSAEIQKLSEGLGVKPDQEPFHRLQIFFARHQGLVELKEIDSFFDFCLKYERPTEQTEPDNWVEFPSAQEFLKTLGTPTEKFDFIQTGLGIQKIKEAHQGIFI